MSLLSIVASSSAFRLPASPPPKGSSIDSDWSTKNKKQPGFLRLISAWYAMVFLQLFWHHENYDSHMPEVTGWSPVATIPRMQLNVSVNPNLTSTRAGVLAWAPAHRGCTIVHSQEEFHDSMWMDHGRAPIQGRWCLRVWPLRQFDWTRISPALTYAAACTTH